MAALPNGTVVAVAAAYGASKPTTIVTNASEAVVTSAAHGYSNGQFVEVTSGWSGANLRMFRIKSATTDTFVLEGFDTSNTSVYPAGTGIGSVRVVTTWQQIPQILGINSSGGTPNSTDYRYLDSDVSYSINNGFAATVDTITIDADAIGSPGYAALQALTAVQTYTAIRKTMKSGSIILTPGKVALNESPTFQDNQVVSVTATLNGAGRVTRYAS